MIYPWQQNAWHKICQAIMNQTALPHALLIHGTKGIGKAHFALALGQTLLCEARLPTGEACNTCQACHWFIQSNHPDFLLVRPTALEKPNEEPNKDHQTDNQENKIDKKSSQEVVLSQIKTLTNAVNIASHRGHYKVVMVYPAESLNVYAANALLKTLEEPPGKTIFILVSDQLDRVLPTILSRCQRLAIATPSQKTALDWLLSQHVAEPHILLKQAGGSPLTALQLAKETAQLKNNKLLLAGLAQGMQIDWLTLAEQLYKENLGQTISYLQRWSYDLLSIRLAQKIRYFPNDDKILTILAQQIKPLKLFKFLDTLKNQQRYINHPLNTKLVLETCLLDYQQLFT